jgi:HD-GYP domain-containing protein (c-di-GMP phosphodiesterase class II)
MTQSAPWQASPLFDRAAAVAVSLHAEFGIPYVVCDAATGEVIYDQDPGSHSTLQLHLQPDAVRGWSADRLVRVMPQGDHSYQLIVPIHGSRGVELLAVAQVESLVASVDIFPEKAARERAMLLGWLEGGSERIRLEDRQMVAKRVEEPQRNMTAAWEALLTLDQLARDLHIHKDPDIGLKRILQAAARLMPAASLTWVPRDAVRNIIEQGERLLVPSEYRKLATNLVQPPESRRWTPTMCNQPETTGWGASFPCIRNLMAFEVSGKRPVGWLIVLNKKNGATFRRSDAALLLPFVGLMELLLRWIGRQQDLKDLLVGLARSLTTAIDAKDNYTYGHSERVARTAVELGRELGLGPDELGDVYLAGLLHDVGKIGIRDTVLHKPGPLTHEEREHIQQHVTIGYSILADLRQIEHILPGVLYHHERYDGGGYPDGLAGEEIPLLARILAVADGYDAMSHPRPYREAMPYRRVEEILKEGAGTQWDKKVVEAFFRCRRTIHAIRQRGVGDSLRLAIDGALRSQSTQVRTSRALSEGLVEGDPSQAS